jgi:hypothetical protein
MRLLGFNYNIGCRTCVSIVNRNVQCDIGALANIRAGSGIKHPMKTKLG